MWDFCLYQCIQVYKCLVWNIAGEFSGGAGYRLSEMTFQQGGLWYMVHNSVLGKLCNLAKNIQQSKSNIRLDCKNNSENIMHK